MGSLPEFAIELGGKNQFTFTLLSVDHINQYGQKSGKLYSQCGLGLRLGPCNACNDV